MDIPDDIPDKRDLVALNHFLKTCNPYMYRLVYKHVDEDVLTTTERLPTSIEYNSNGFFNLNFILPCSGSVLFADDFAIFCKRSDYYRKFYPRLNPDHPQPVSKPIFPEPDLVKTDFYDPVYALDGTESGNILERENAKAIIHLINELVLPIIVDANNEIVNIDSIVVSVNELVTEITFDYANGYLNLGVFR